VSIFRRELANKIRRGRVVGNLYVVTRRPIGMSGIIAEFETEGECDAFIEAAERSDFETTGLIFPSIR
jgi:hypothetical protein